MPLAVWQRNIVNGSGDVQASAAVEVRQEISGSPLAVIYADRDGVTPLANPFQADADGFARFYVAGGAYRITATKGAFQRIWRHVGIGTAQETDFDALTGGLTVTYPSFVPDAVVDQLADRDAYDNQFVGFSVLVRLDDGSPPADDPRVYFLLNPDESPPEWTDGIAFANALGGLPIDTLADPAADAFLGWDDSDSEIQFLTASEALAIIKTVDGAGSGLDADLLDGNNIGTSGAAVPLLNGTNTWANQQTFSAAINLTSGQIAFPASQAASAGANTLDDYEEGVWTATIITSGVAPTTLTYSAQVGTYTKIGRLVYFTGVIIINSFTLGSGTGNISFATLPFTVGQTAFCCNARTAGVDWASGTQIYGEAAGTSVSLNTVGDNIAGAAVALSGLASGDIVSVQGCYQA